METNNCYITKENYEVKIQAVKNGKHLDILYKDPDWRVRLEVAKKNSHLDDLYYDSHWMVRLEAAIQKCRLFKANRAFKGDKSNENN